MDKNIFFVKEFFNPENKYFPIYSWVWNESLTENEIKRQLDKMYEDNIRGVYVIPMPPEFRPQTMVTDMNPQYLTDGYFKMFSYAVEYAHSKGMEFWLYDEAGWPSGNANFTITQENEHLKLIRIVREGEIYRDENFSDLTNPETTEKFILSTHEKYKEKMGDSFKKLSPYVFTDEPSLRPLPYTEMVKKEYRKRTGKELDIEKMYKRNDAQFNIIYHDICAQLFADNYFKPIKDWCRANDMMSSGHLDCEDTTLGFKAGFHHPMRQLRQMDVPGVDVIWDQITPKKQNRFYPRLASSASEQIGSGLSVTESYAASGTLSFEQMRYIAGYQFVRGINILNCMLLMYDCHSYYVLRERPMFNVKQPGMEYLKNFNSYIASLEYFMQNGSPDTKCALYLPMRSLWANDENTQNVVDAYEKMGALIEKNHSQFDIVDDDLLAECDQKDLKEGKIKAGRATYSILYIPADKYMSENIKEKISIFKNGGGKVYYSNNAEYFSDISISGDDGYLRVHKRKYENCDVYMLFNESADKVTAKLNFEQESYEVDWQKNEIYMAENEYEFESGEIRVFVCGNVDVKLDSKKMFGEKMTEITDFQVKPLKKMIIDEKCAEYIELDEKYEKKGCGLWADFLGEDFSGQCEYKTTFKSDDVLCDKILSLGSVYYSCEVILNGENVGVEIAPPYNFTLRKELLKKENELIIKVSNTAANAYVNFEIPENWESKHVGAYHNSSVEFEKKILCGGLLGPVEIFNIK